MDKRLCLTCDDASAGYLKQYHQAAVPRPTIVPLHVRLIRSPVVDPTFPVTDGIRDCESDIPEDALRLPAIEPTINSLLPRWKDADRIEVYVDPDPNSQLLVMFLLSEALRAVLDRPDVFLLHGQIRWGQVDARTPPDTVASSTRVTERHRTAAASIWSAYCSPTPEAWLGLRPEDVALFPFLEGARQALLDDLPRRDTGLGACERLALTSIGADGNSVSGVISAFVEDPSPLIDLPQIIALLSSLASGAAPLIDGLNGRLGADDFCDDADAWDAFRGSCVRLTDVGRKILAGELDFVEVHGIDRWWGGTRLNGHACWRWDHRTRALIPPANS